jgi:hypothetical protein
MIQLMKSDFCQKKAAGLEAKQHFKRSQLLPTLDISQPRGLDKAPAPAVHVPSSQKLPTPAPDFRPSLNQ